MQEHPVGNKISKEKGHDKITTTPEKRNFERNHIAKESNSIAESSTKKSYQVVENARDRLRTPAEEIPEIHFIGEIHSGIGFQGNKSISCKWTVEWGKMWSILEGDVSGQSQYSFSPYSDWAVWNHPIDIHFTSASIQGWPRMLLHVLALDEFGRTDLIGYGFIHLPSTPGKQCQLCEFSFLILTYAHPCIYKRLKDFMI